MTAQDQSLAKSFEPAAIEAKWGPEWESRGIAKPTFDPDRPDFAIQLPPPNVTGTLHMGHAFNQTIMDGLARHARMLGANQRQLLRTVYLPSATSWVFSSLHTSVGLAFVGAVVGEYLGSARGVGYLILQAEGTFDVNTVFAGIIVLTAFALVLDGVVGLIERRLMTWQPQAGETEKI